MSSHAGGPDHRRPILLVDDWAEQGSQAATACDLVRRTGASFVGTALVVDQLDNLSRSRLGHVTSLVTADELGAAPDRPPERSAEGIGYWDGGVSIVVSGSRDGCRLRAARPSAARLMTSEELVTAFPAVPVSSASARALAPGHRRLMWPTYT